MYSNNHLSWEKAPALATANETASIELAPNLDFTHPNSFLDPSNYSYINLSMENYSSGFLSFKAGPIILFIFSTAFITPFPMKALPPSLNSNASNSPVEAPEATIALKDPLLVKTSASTVGNPLESSNYLPTIFLIVMPNFLALDFHILDWYH